MMEARMEDQPIPEESQKRGRRRKKLLYRLIREQMEFYFSDCNIAKDRFISQQLEKDEYIPLSVFLSFNKIRRLTDKDYELRKAISLSEVLELSQDAMKVKRKTPIRIKANEEECTIYVERLPVETEHDWLKSVFSKFGTVDYVSIPRYKHNKIIKGFAFIEYADPESAKRVLEYCEAIGCKLPTTMLPDQLVSISSFQSEKDEALNDFINKTETESDNKNSDNPEQDENSLAEKQESAEPEVKEPNDENISTVIKEPEIKKEERHKRKLEENNENKEPKNEETETSKSKKLKTETETEGSEADDPEGESEGKTEGTEGKTKRKRKKKKKCIGEILQYGLRVLSKKEWRQLRNKYLNLQRQKMQNLKQHLNRNRFSSQNSVETTENCTELEESKPRFEFTPGVIVHIVWPDAINDIKQVKNDIKAEENVQYIDVKQGSNEGFVRFSDNASAKTFCETDTINANKYILDGPAEKEYWDTIIQQQREQRFKRETKKKIRGRNKLLKKAEKALGKHIKFDE